MYSIFYNLHTCLSRINKLIPVDWQNHIGIYNNYMPMGKTIPAVECRINVGYLLTQVVECLSSCLTDSSSESRKAAAYSTTLIIKGLHLKCFEVSA